MLKKELDRFTVDRGHPIKNRQNEFAKHKKFNILLKRKGYFFNGRPRKSKVSQTSQDLVCGSALSWKAS